MKEITDDVIKQIHRNLRAFGYAQLTIDHVREEVSHLKEGQKPAGIIGMFAEQMLKNNGYL